MGELEIILEAEYTSITAEVIILCNKKQIYNGVIKGRIKINHNIEKIGYLDLKIIKSGHTPDLVNHGHKQRLIIKKIRLNGIELKIEAFGNFFPKDNLYITEKNLQTNILAWNGEWNIKINDTYDVPGHLTSEGKQITKFFSSRQIACFGASNTKRDLSNEKFKVGLWPDYLARLTKHSVQNYGLPGSNIPEITCLLEKYSKQFSNSNLIILSPHSFRFQIKEDTNWINSLNFGLLDKTVVLHGEEHYIAVLSGKLMSLFDKISKNNNLYFCPDNESEYEVFQRTPLKKYMIPKIEFANYKVDKNRHYEEKFHNDFAKKIIKHIGINDSDNRR
jgi:hypothetical protein